MVSVFFKGGVFKVEGLNVAKVGGGTKYFFAPHTQMLSYAPMYIVNVHHCIVHMFYIIKNTVRLHKVVFLVHSFDGHIVSLPVFFIKRLAEAVDMN